ncbi:MAG: hypothetical protein DMG67_06930 [Acidobacteria bacterium]|nr:MAG: hypothetical protein DMG67_06930 [Acidobacteriota bacterium]
MLTVKALRVLRSADVVLYDALTAPAILALVPSTTKLVKFGQALRNKGNRTRRNKSLNCRLCQEGKPSYA